MSRLMIAVPHAETEGALHDALRRTAWLVGGRGVVVLMPDDDSPHDFAIASAWAPDGIPANVPSLAIGDHSWLAEFLQDLERPVILAAADIPKEAAVLRWIADHQELVGIGLIPVVSAIDRVGVVAVGFSALPDRVGRLRFESLGALGPLVLSVRERHQHATDLYSFQPSTAVAAASEVERTAR